MRSLVILLLLCGCLPTATQPAIDAGDASLPKASLDGGDLGTQVCTHLATIGCPQPATCATTLDTKQGAFTDFKPKCLLAATSVLEANTCGSIHCP